MRIAPAVAQAAMDSGVATRPIADIDAYRERLQQLRLPLGHVHEAGVRAAKKAVRQARIVYAEGEEERVLRAAQVVVDEGSRGRS
jgi:malate dehydrogenase (oxaloacetate-decarboxylating)(NADP+)